MSNIRTSLHLIDACPASVILHPGNMPVETIQTAWNALKRDRGQSCNWDRLHSLPSHHQITAQSENSSEDTVQTILDRCAGRAASIRQQAAARFQSRHARRPAGYAPTGGDAA